MARLNVIAENQKNVLQNLFKFRRGNTYLPNIINDIGSIEALFKLLTPLKQYGLKPQMRVGEKYLQTVRVEGRRNAGCSLLQDLAPVP